MVKRRITSPSGSRRAVFIVPDTGRGTRAERFYLSQGWVRERELGASVTMRLFRPVLAPAPA